MKIFIDINNNEELARYLQANSWSGAKDRINSMNYET